MRISDWSSYVCSSDLSERGVNAVLVDGSNFFREDKGAKAGMDALRARVADLPKTATLITSHNEKNAISRDLVEKAGRTVVFATAWRVSDHSKPIGIDGRTVTLSERKTELAVGLAIGRAPCREKVCEYG